MAAPPGRKAPSIEMSKPPENSTRLHRGRLRDVVVVLCAASALFIPIDWPVASAGILFVLLGCGLHLLVKGQLIRNTTLCTEGAYAVVRHPYYLANYMIDTGLCLASGNVFLVLLYPFLFFWAYGKTFRDEEALLASMHPGKFEAYAAAVPAVFPEASSLAAVRGMFRGFSRHRISRGEIKRQFRFGFLLSGILLLRLIGFAGLRGIATGTSGLSIAESILLGVCFLFLVVSAVIPKQREDVACEGGTP